MEKLRKIKERFEKARADRNQYDSNIDTAFKYTIPQRRVYLEASNKLAPLPEIFDSTAVIATQRFATKLQSMLVPTAQNWMKLTPGSSVDDEERDGLQEEYDKDTKKFFNEIKHSNFDIQVAESFQDLAVTTGALLCNPAPLGSISAVQYKAVTISELYPETPSDGIIRTVFREHSVRIDEIQSLYVGSKISAEDEKAMERDPNAKVKIVDACIYFTKEDHYEITVFNPAQDFMYQEITEKISPWIVFRENVVTGVALGYGRNMRLLPDIKTLNKVVELTLKGGSIAVSGTFTAHDDGVLNPYNVRLRPGGVIPVMSNDQRNPSIARLDTPTAFDWANLEIQTLQARINDVLLSNPYGSIENTPVRSATEITARNRDLFDSVSSSFGRLQVEFVAPVIKRTVYLMQKAGKMREDFVLNGVDASYDFVSPLTRLQQSADIENVLEWISVVGTFGQETTELGIAMEKVPAWLGEKYSVPQELIRPQNKDANPSQEEVVEGTAEANMAMAPEGGAGMEAPGLGGLGVASPGGLDPMFPTM